MIHMHRADIEQSQLPGQTSQLASPPRRYYVELSLDALDEQGCLLDSLIDYTFDTLHALHLDLRIVSEARS